MRMPLAGLGLLAVFAAASTASATEVYRWVDENGRVHFTDRPQNIDQEPISVKPSAPNVDPDQEQRRQKQQRLLQIFAEDRERQQSAKQEEEVRRAEMERACRNARNELHDLERGGVFYELGKDGERHYLSQQEVDQRKARWRAEAQRTCRQ